VVEAEPSHGIDTRLLGTPLAAYTTAVLDAAAEWVLPLVELVEPHAGSMSTVAPMRSNAATESNAVLSLDFMGISSDVG
jgi:hypothetical protein